MIPGYTTILRCPGCHVWVESHDKCFKHWAKLCPHLEEQDMVDEGAPNHVEHWEIVD